MAASAVLLAMLLLRLLRPHHWVKNGLVFLPLVAGHVVEAGAWLRGLAAFVAFGLVASGNYVVNDILDREHDRLHPTKRHRPVAAGAVALSTAWALAAACIGAGLVVGLLLSPALFAVLVLYLLLAQAYSLRIKRAFVADLFALVAFYLLRVFAGSAAVGILPSIWLLAFVVFAFLSLAALKRTSELALLQGRGEERSAGRAYVVDDRLLVAVVALAAGYAAVVVLALYLDSEPARRLYAQPEVLWLLCPLLLFWFTRAVALAGRGAVPDDPVVFALEDRVSLLCGAAALLVLAGATVPWTP